MDHEKRIDRVRDRLVEQDKDAFLVVGGADCFYLSGFYTDPGASYPMVVVPAEGEATLYVSSLDRSADNDSSIRVEIPDSQISEALISELEGKKVLAGGNPDLNLYSTLDEELSITLDTVFIRDMRRVKEQEEIDRIEQACTIAENAIGTVKEEFETGTEREVAARLEYSMRLNGSDGTPFPTIAASGPSSATPHHATGDGPVEGPLLLDLGARTGGYVSDMSRTLHVGDPRERYREVYRAVLEAQRAAGDVLEAGVAAADVDGAARDVLEEHGFLDAFIHSTGHGVGISVHEPPNLHAESDAELEAGMVVTVEPGVYLEGEFGVRIEDVYLVEENGAERLTSLSRELEDNIIEV